MLFKKRYLHASYGGIISFIIFSIAVVLVPGVGPSEEVQIILTVSTFLFAILAGFFISRLNTRYNDVREIIAEEDARFKSLYKTSKIYGKKFSDRIADLIDKYYIKLYDRAFYSNKYNEKYFNQIWKEIEKAKKHKSDSVYENLLDDLTQIEKCRNTADAIIEEKISLGKWAVLIFLSSIILFSIFYLKTPQIYSQIITVLLSSVLVIIILIIRDLQNFMLGGDILLEESGEHVMETIDRLRYYNKMLLDAGLCKIPSFVRKYRLGFHHPDSHNFNIRVVENKNFKEKKERWDRI